MHRVTFKVASVSKAAAGVRVAARNCETDQIYGRMVGDLHELDTGFVGGDGQIEAAVSIEIRQDDSIRRVDVDVSQVLQGSVADAPQEVHLVPTARGKCDIRMAVAIEIGYRHADGVGAGLSVAGDGAQRSAGSAQQNTDAVTPEIRDDDIHVRIGIQIADGKFVRTDTDRIELRRTESPRGILQEHSHLIHIIQGGYDVQAPVVVHVGQPDRERPAADWLGHRRVQGSRGVPVKNAHVLAIGIAHDQICMAILIDVSVSDCHRALTRGVLHLRQKGAIPKAPKDTERVGAIIGTGDVHNAVAVQVANFQVVDQRTSIAGRVVDGRLEAPIAAAQEHADRQLRVIRRDQVENRVTIQVSRPDSGGTRDWVRGLNLADLGIEIENIKNTIAIAEPRDGRVGTAAGNNG